MKLKQVGSEYCVKPHKLFKIIREYIKRQLEHFNLLLNILRCLGMKHAMDPPGAAGGFQSLIGGFIVFIKLRNL